MKLSSVKPDENMVVLACGKGGCGKTTAIASFPKPMYIFDIDGRIKGIWGSDIIPDKEKELIEFDQPTPRDGFKWIEDKLNEFEGKYNKRNLEFKTILIESADWLSEFLIQDSFRIKTNQLPGSASKPTDQIQDRKGVNIRGNVHTATIDDYKHVMSAFKQMHVFFKTFKKVNIILSAGTTPVYGPAPGAGQYDPPIVVGRKIYASQGLSDLLLRMFDEVWEFNKEETGNTLRDPLKYTVKFRSDIAKTCIKDLPNSLDITNKNFYEQIKALLPKSTEQVTDNATLPTR